MAKDDVGSLVASLGMDVTEFKTGITIINREMKVLKSEFEATQATLGPLASSMDGLKSKSENLSKQIDLQKQKVAKLAEIHEKAKIDKGEDAKATQELAIKLNKAQAELGRMQNALNLTQKEMKELDSASDKAGASVDKFSKHVSGVKNDLHGVDNGVSGVTSSIGKMVAVIGTIGIIDRTVDAIKKLTTAGFDYNRTMEQNKIAFDTMLGSADKSKKLLDELAKMAATTPFEFPELVGSAKKMLAFGFEANKIPGILKSVGDASAGLGLGADGVNRIVMALGQMKAKGKISGEEMLQLTEAGVPALDILAKAFGKTTAEISKMQEKGLLPVDKTLNALIDGMEKRFPNLMEKQSKSFDGLMSTLRDSVNMTMGKVLEPAFQELTKEILPDAIDQVGKFAQAIQEGKTPIEATRALIVDRFGADTALTFDKLIRTMNNLKDGAVSLEPAISDTFKYFVNDVIPKLVTFADENSPKVKEVLQNINDIFVALEPAIKAINDLLLSNALDNLRSAIDLVAGLTGAINDLLNLKWDGLWENLKRASEAFNKINEFVRMLQNPYGVLAEKSTKFIWSDFFNSIYGNTEGRAVGDNNWRGGLVRVHEQGGELINLPKGSQIIPHDISMEIARATGQALASKSNQSVITVPVYLDGYIIAQAIADYSDKIQGNNLKSAARGVGL